MPSGMDLLHELTSESPFGTKGIQGNRRPTRVGRQTESPCVKSPSVVQNRTGCDADPERHHRYVPQKGKRRYASHAEAIQALTVRTGRLATEQT